MMPTIDSTRLKYIADCLYNVNKTARVQLGAETIGVRSPDHATMITIENEKGGNVIDTQPYVTTSEAIGNGLSRFKGTITFAEDGKSHQIGADVTVCHPECKGQDCNGLMPINVVFPYRASISAELLKILAAQDFKDDPVIYIRNDSEGHYIGILDNICVRMKGNIEVSGYTTFAAAFLRKLAKMVKGSVTIDWAALSLMRFTWEAYGLRMSYYIAPRIIEDEKIIKRLDLKVVL